MKQDRQQRQDKLDSRFQNGADRGYGWNATEDNDSWDNEDRHYIPGPRGPEADDFEKRISLPSDDSDEDNV